MTGRLAHPTNRRWGHGHQLRAHQPARRGAAHGV